MNTPHQNDNPDCQCPQCLEDPPVLVVEYSQQEDNVVDVHAVLEGIDVEEQLHPGEDLDEYDAVQEELTSVFDKYNLSVTVDLKPGGGVIIRSQDSRVDTATGPLFKQIH